MRHESMILYIPRDRAHSLAEGVDLPLQTTGAALFADISGFTPLTEALTRTFGARRGAEEITRQLNRVYTVLIAEIDRYHGTIIGFSGDAVTCWFENAATNEDGPGLALACAFALQEAMMGFARVSLPDGETVTLSLKLALATGPAVRFVVGNPDVLLIDVLVGETITRMADSEHQAQKGEIVVDAATVETVNRTHEAIRVLEWRTDKHTGERFAVVERFGEVSAPRPWPPLMSNQLTPDQVRPWLMKVFYDRPDDTLTDLRQAAALFVRFQGIDYEHDPAAPQKLDVYIRWVQEIMVRRGGTLIQLTTGDKGSYLYFAFGAPLAYDNNAELAAQAALELMAIPPELNFITPVQMGLSQGIMRTGAYGGATRRTYGVMGDDTNLAARLMGAAHHRQILMSERITKAISTKFIVRALDSIRVKGKSEPIPITELMSRGEAPRESQVFARPLIGRTVEIIELVGRLRSLFEHKPAGVTYVWGEPGIGKSHLIASARTYLVAKGSVTWFSCPSEQIVRQSLHTFMPLLDNYFAQEAGASDAEKKAQFEVIFDHLVSAVENNPSDQIAAIIVELEETRWFIGALLGLRWFGSAFENLDPKLRFERSLQAVGTLLRAESLRQPLVVHVQDTQWIDEDSKILLRIIADSTDQFPLALIMDSRTPAEAFRAELALRENVSFYTMDINRLSPQSVRELAQTALQGKITNELHTFLVERASGNPFFTEQLALDLSERGFLSKTVDERWTLQAGHSEEMPGTINAVLIARLDRLVNDVRIIVQIASVLGQEFEVPVLAAMTNDGANVLARVKQAEAETIWVGSSDWVYLFRHALLRDAAYSMQLQERLRVLHASAGAAIERLYAADLSDKYPDLAYHFERSALYDQAVNYLIKSGQSMMAIYANREALTSFQRAAELSKLIALPLQELAPIYEGLGDLFETSGEYQQAIHNYQRALESVSAEQAGWRVRLHRKTGQALQKWGRYAEANTSYEAALTELQADLNTDEACQIYAGLSMINYRQDKLDDAIELAMLALMMAQEDKRNLAQANQNLGILHWKKQDWSVALDYNNQSLALWQELNNLNGCAAIYNNLGLLSQATNDPDQALQYFTESLKLFEKVGNQHGLACAYDNLGQTYMEKGEPERAMQCLEQAVGILAKIGLNETEVFSSMWQSGTW